MIKLATRKTLALMTTLAIAAIPMAAHADGLPGFAGKARVNSQSSCFIESWGSAYNTCSSTTDINYALGVSASGTHTVRLYTNASSVTSSNVCRSYAISPTGGIVTGTTATWLVGTAKAIETSVSVPSWGAMWTVCAVPAGAQVLHVHNS